MTQDSQQDWLSFERTTRERETHTHTEAQGESRWPNYLPFPLASHDMPTMYTVKYHREYLSQQCLFVKGHMANLIRLSPTNPSEEREFQSSLSLHTHTPSARDKRKDATNHSPTNLLFRERPFALLVSPNKGIFLPK